MLTFTQNLQTSVNLKYTFEEMRNVMKFPQTKLQSFPTISKTPH